MSDALIHAFTEPGSSYPPFINLSRLEDGSVRIIVRSARNEAGGEGATAVIVLSEADWRSIAWSAFAETNDRMKAAGNGPVPSLSQAQIKHMVDRFLGWKLPENFRPDAGISFEPEYNVEYNASRGMPPARHEPIGTNVFDATQADAMVRYMLDGLPPE